jgi:glucan phosphorylase
VNGQNGWTFGPDGLEAHGDDADADGLYDLLETQVAPLFYDRDGDGVPKAWVKMMKEAIVSSVFEFSTHRMLMDYANKAYYPLAKAATEG